jgi:hypothetical protein
MLPIRQTTRSLIIPACRTSLVRVVAALLRAWRRSPERPARVAERAHRPAALRRVAVFSPPASSVMVRSPRVRTRGAHQAAQLPAQARPMMTAPCLLRETSMKLT